MSGQWDSRTAGGCLNHPTTYKNNPLYRLQLGPRDSSQLIVELRGPKVYQVGIELSITSLEDPNITAPFVSRSTGNYRSGFCVLDLENLPAGTYTVRPSTFLPEQEGPYFLKFKCTTNLTIERVH